MTTPNDTPNFVTIQLDKGQSTIISPEDADLAELRWYAEFKSTYNRKDAYLARRRIQGKIQSIHRIIVSRILGRELSSKEQVDHINGNPLDNRRNNLRLATIAQNGANRGKPRTNQTGFKGVTFIKRCNKYRAMITVRGETKHLGYFDTPEEAHGAYCKAADEGFGEFANFGQ